MQLFSMRVQFMTTLEPKPDRNYWTTPTKSRSNEKLKRQGISDEVKFQRASERLFCWHQEKPTRNINIIDVCGKLRSKERVENSNFKLRKIQRRWKIRYQPAREASATLNMRLTVPGYFVKASEETVMTWLLSHWRETVKFNTPPGPSSSLENVLRLEVICVPIIIWFWTRYLI